MITSLMKLIGYSKEPQGIPNYDPGKALEEFYRPYGARNDGRAVRVDWGYVVLPLIGKTKDVVLLGPTHMHPTCFVRTESDKEIDSKHFVLQNQLYLSEKGSFFQCLSTADDTEVWFCKHGAIVCAGEDRGLVMGVHAIAIKSALEELESYRREKISYLGDHPYFVIPSNQKIADHARSIIMSGLENRLTGV